MSLRQRAQLRFAGIASRIGYDEAAPALGDFTTSPRMIIISVIAIGIGLLGAFVALALLRLIGLFTNLFFFGEWGTSLRSPADSDIGLLVLVVPVVGGLIIGLMARYGSERIRGHGIPEAIEAILTNGSRVQPRVAILKPLSSAISIGSGGPFGAEGPIIMTGGAFGSIIGQSLHLSGAERRTLLVAGAAAGMSATFAAPVSAVLLSVELLLFEWKPRSLIPVALASASAALMRHYIIGAGPLFSVPPHAEFIGPMGLLSCVLIGISAGALSAGVSAAVYASEDAFHRLPIHWMWWPAIGGLAIGIGGLICPHALGVGYDNIEALLAGDTSAKLILGVLLVKSTIWAVSLGSGTSGGVLAPLLMMGAALGGAESNFLPFEGAGFWPLISMAATLGGTMGSPLTGTMFALELTHDVNALLPLIVAVMVAHGFTVLVMKRSILTEKLSRRGQHLGREYSIDPLETQLVRHVMRPHATTLPANLTIRELAESSAGRPHTQPLYPIVGDGGRLTGVITRSHLEALLARSENGASELRLGQIDDPAPVVAYPGEPLRLVAYRMAETGRTLLPVVTVEGRELVGMVSLKDLLTARARSLNEERQRERLLRVRLGRSGASARVPAD